MQRRHWMVTIQTRKDGTDDWQMMFEKTVCDWQHLTEVRQLRYAIMQIEVGETDRPHIQAYVEFLRPKRLSEAKRTLGWNHAHLEPRWGTRTQAREYCMKTEVIDEENEEFSDDWRCEFGIWRPDREGLRGERNLSDVAVDLVVQGMHPREIAKRHPKAYFTHSRKIWDLHRILFREGATDKWNYEIQQEVEEE